MDPITERVLAAVLATLIVSFAGWSWKNYLKNRVYLFIRKDRRKHLEGRWRGVADQPAIGLYEFVIDLKVGSRKIKGTGKLKGEEKIDMIFEGGYRNDRFLELHYRNQDEGVIQFGTLIFELVAKSSELSGKFLGFGPKDEKLVSGDVKMDRD